ncbi:type VI secretion system baseplate subunit TssF [Serratia sp. (in: enterobacteria)]|uniref:type VI secretion system baseplate subunit TssF n=1 Tax=Serratia sp. (in: enterobacteria) TaxID=616 RepID=UPI0039893C01
MESFEDLFRDESDYLQQLAEYQAKGAPHLLNFLPNSRDPDMARLVEGFTVLTARVRQKIRDDFPEITHNLLAGVWPLPLRPIPSTSVIQFSPKNGGIDNATDVPRQSQIFAEYDDHTTTFQTCHELHIEPLTLIGRESPTAPTTPANGQEQNQEQAPAEQTPVTAASPTPGQTPSQEQASLAQTNEEIKPETPPSETHTLTFYSLYMHLCHWPFYDANGELPRPAYWGDCIEFEVAERAKEKIRGCFVRQNGSNTTKLAILPKGTVITIGENIKIIMVGIN